MSHIAPVSFKVAATLLAYRVVTALSSTAETVAYPENDLRPYIGITANTVLDTTGSIPVIIHGIAKLYFNDTCTTGQLVGADSSGRGIAFGTIANTTTSLTLSSAYIGVLVGPTVAATGTIANVLIMPGFARNV
jgi:hypothetical protein